MGASAGSVKQEALLYETNPEWAELLRLSHQEQLQPSHPIPNDIWQAVLRGNAALHPAILRPARQALSPVPRVRTFTPPTSFDLPAGYNSFAVLVPPIPLAKAEVDHMEVDPDEMESELDIIWCAPRVPTRLSSSTMRSLFA